MKHDAFDEALRRRAQREKSALSTRAEERVARAIREGQARAASHARAQGERDTAAFVWPGEERQAPHKPRRRITRLIPLITGAAACLTAAAFDIVDIRRGGLGARLQGVKAPSNLSVEVNAVQARVPADSIARPFAFLQESAGTVSSREAVSSLSDVSAAASVGLDWGDARYLALFLWNEEAGGYLREVAGWPFACYPTARARMTGDEGAMVRPAFANVIVQWVAYDALSPTVQTPLLVGEGAADLFVGVRHVQGTWSRAACDARTLYRDESGREVLLEPGTTWIALFPANASLIFE